MSVVIGFTKSQEGVREWQKLGLPYPDNLDAFRLPRQFWS